jgi:hypothetical protein
MLNLCHPNPCTLINVEEKEKIKMLHLTHSGFYAGKTICGTPRNDQDTYQHFSLTFKLPQNADLCPKCEKIYLEEENTVEDWPGSAETKDN